ncbi:hypothetical protein [Pseudoalteromonas luteoviolacea]|uniref:Lipoprotein n=1 Tax=Pseudoalteromonas luteoviolacea NCIMB 1942 TaxID=1365253 RepID=A0A167BHC3_9GAMM|nr:hypothetical protein [Pseudoalteromonas luteoviolacea]KZN46540.1 hypothetical protein N482_12170 [Pseudoalteromonas luteoviolacea NCIMB 1942]KZW98985.1 hypothetical protein JL49_20005 [Pseudoalteromonas luteoviolacea]
MKRKAGTIFGIALTLLAGCETSYTATEQQVEHEEGSLDQLIADKGCDASFQCKVIAVGERLTCGGPSKYLVYSSRNVDEAQVERAAQLITAEEKARNRDAIASDMCEPVLPIQALCISSTCQSIVLK